MIGPLGGILTTMKPSGRSSRLFGIDQVQSFLKENNAQKEIFNKIGHIGTLDPFATGILPTAFGASCKLCDIIKSEPKRYTAIIRVGFETDTGDLTGTPTNTSDASIDWNAFENIRPNFIGNIQQIPPAFSATKINGRRAYELARQGQQVHLKPKQVQVLELDCKPIDHEHFQLDCLVGKGTFVRTLGEDICRAMGIRGHLIALHRSASGLFDEPKYWDGIDIICTNFPKLQFSMGVQESIDKIKGGQPLRSLLSKTLQDSMIENKVYSLFSEANDQLPLALIVKQTTNVKYMVTFGHQYAQHELISSS